MAEIAAIVVAAGRGTRAGGGIPKQFRPLAGRPMVRATLDLFAAHPEVSYTQPVINRDDMARFRLAADGIVTLEPAFGGETRQASVRAGLEALVNRRPDIVLIHDAARPLLTSALVSRAIAAAKTTGAAVPALAVTDTLKAVSADGRVTNTLDRHVVRTVQTPQAFAFDAIYDAHRKAAAAGRDDFTDDAALAEWAGLQVSVFEGDAGNIKLTTPEDFMHVEARMLGDIRTGTGIDVHSFGPGKHVTLGGVAIPHERGLDGHSDADVVLHALVDAILGSLADGDIGVHFPPSDPQWRGASSDRFVSFAMERLRGRGGRLTHADINIVCEAPRIGPHRDAMRTRIAELCDISLDRVAIKATTSEGLGFTGRSEGIAAFATVTVRLPFMTATLDDDIVAAAETLLDICKRKNLLIATAESCTAGLVAGTLTEVPGTSSILDRGFITYSNDAKHEMLGVSRHILKQYGAVSRETAEAMARGVLGHSKVHLAVSVTGIAGPNGGNTDKPVGLVHFAAATRGGKLIHAEKRYGNIGRDKVRKQSVLQAFLMLHDLAEGKSGNPQPPSV